MTTVFGTKKITRSILNKVNFVFVNIREIKRPGIKTDFFVGFAELERSRN